MNISSSVLRECWKNTCLCHVEYGVWRLPVCILHGCSLIFFSLTIHYLYKQLSCPPLNHQLTSFQPHNHYCQHFLNSLIPFFCIKLKCQSCQLQIWRTRKDMLSKLARTKAVNVVMLQKYGLKQMMTMMMEVMILHQLHNLSAYYI